MADWSEQASFSTQQVDETEIRDETPVLRYENLSADTQNIIRSTIESPDRHSTVYGEDDWPDRFFYSDYTTPGQGTYAVIYDGEYYRLSTYDGGGFPPFYWLIELPFIFYGLVLSWGAYDTYRGNLSIRTIGLASLFGVGFHLLGPEFDFPLLTPMEFVGLGTFASMLLVLGFAFEHGGE